MGKAFVALFILIFVKIERSAARLVLLFFFLSFFPFLIFLHLILRGFKHKALLSLGKILFMIEFHSQYLSKLCISESWVLLFLSA